MRVDLYGARRGGSEARHHTIRPGRPDRTVCVFGYRVDAAHQELPRLPPSGTVEGEHSDSVHGGRIYEVLALGQRPEPPVQHTLHPSLPDAGEPVEAGIGRGDQAAQVLKPANTSLRSAAKKLR